MQNSAKKSSRKQIRFYSNCCYVLLPYNSFRITDVEESHMHSFSSQGLDTMFIFRIIYIIMAKEEQWSHCLWLTISHQHERFNREEMRQVCIRPFWDSESLVETPAYCAIPTTNQTGLYGKKLNLYFSLLLSHRTTILSIRPWLLSISQHCSIVMCVISWKFCAVFLCSLFDFMWHWAISCSMM